MGWLEDTTARWLRVMAATGYGSTPLDEGVRLISETGETATARTSRFRKPKQGGAKRSGPGRSGPGQGAPGQSGAKQGGIEASVVTALSRQLITGVLASDFLIGRLCTATGRTRAEILAELSGGLSRWLNDEQLRVLQLELSASCAELREPERASYVGLGSRIEELLRLAETQAGLLVQEAHDQAAQITSSAFGHPPATDRSACPRCDATWPDGGRE